jgi:hypothetical protein
MTRYSAAPAWRWRTASAAALFALTLIGTGTRADVLLDETRAVGATVAPYEKTFSVATPGTLEVDIVDQALPAALGALRATVTRGDTIVGTPLTAAGRITFDAAANTTYAVRIVGRPASGQPAGTVGVRVTRASDPQPRPLIVDDVNVFQATLTPGLTYTNGGTGQVVNFTEAGTYTATFTDFAFPAALVAPSSASPAALILFGSQTTPILAITQPSQLNTAVTFNVPAPTTPGPSQYQLFISATASAAARAGLFGLRIVGGPSNRVVYDATTAVGALEAGEPFTNPAAGSLTLQVRDAAFPAALTQVGAVLSAGGTRVGTPVFGTNSGTATAPAGPLLLWTAGTAGATPGTFQATVATTAGPTLVTRVRAVSSSAANAPQAFLYPVTLPAPGGYRARVTDFQFPSSLQSLQFAVLQNGAPVVQSTTAGVLDFNAVAGAAQLYVLAQAPTGGSGLFGAEVLTTNTPPSNVLDRTQAVGALSDARPITATTAGRYDVALKDVGWPANFQNLAFAVTRGGQVVGRIFGGGTFFFDATPGTYLGTLVATPNATEAAGLYSVRIQSTVPTVTLSANSASVQAGQNAQLTWSSTAATSCTASGGWSGARALSGAESVGPLNTNTTFTLACTGPGGTTSASTTVTATPVPGSGGGGGGGSVGFGGLAALGVLALGRWRRRLASGHASN